MLENFYYVINNYIKMVDFFKIDIYNRIVVKIANVAQ